MNYEEWMLGQFEVKKIIRGQGRMAETRICFKTPLANYTFSPQDWEKVKNKIINSKV